MLANVYKKGMKVSDYLASEKLDGIRAYWNGKNLISRTGKIFHTPKWFISNFPSQALDGELWIARNSFELTSSIVSRKSPDTRWKKVKYMVFDLPEAKGNFENRYKTLKKIITNSSAKNLRIVQQKEFPHHQALIKYLNQITKKGSEGLMLHKKNSFYQKGRSNDLLKLKEFFDAEAIVIKHNEGKGRFKGMLGSLVVETPEKIRFKIGTGFKDQERKNPPPLGSVITYKYRGFTNSGKPKFPSFWRIKQK